MYIHGSIATTFYFYFYFYLFIFFFLSVFLLSAFLGLLFALHASAQRTILACHANQQLGLVCSWNPGASLVYIAEILSGELCVQKFQLLLPPYVV